MITSRDGNTQIVFTLRVCVYGQSVVFLIADRCLIEIKKMIEFEDECCQTKGTKRSGLRVGGHYLNFQKNKN